MNKLKLLKWALGMFAYCAKWIDCFGDKIQRLVDTKIIPLNTKTLKAFQLRKNELENAALKSIDEGKLFAVKCDA